MKYLKLEEVEKKIGIPAPAWSCRCYEIACLLIAKKLVPGGKALYGHWLGPVDPGSPFRKRTIVHHGWILCKDKEMIIDPTRWVFENVAPYIYQAPDFDGYYDAGGNVWLKKNMRPPPVFNMKEATFKADSDFCMLMHEHFDLLACGSRFSFDQVFWMAHLPLDIMSEHGKRIFTWISGIGHAALIPIDNRKILLGDKDPSRRAFAGCKVKVK